MTKEALKLALEALETPWNAPYVDGCDLALGKKVKAITAIKEALVNEALEKMAENARELGLDYEPAQRTWVGLTDEEKNKMAFIAGSDKYWLIRLVENKLKEKNETT